MEASPWCKDALFVLTTHGDGAATTLHRGWKAICDAVIAVHYFEPDSNQRDEIMARFTDWEIWQNQGGFPWLWHSDYEDGAVTVQRVTVPPNAAGGPGSASNTESSPTQPVADCPLHSGRSRYHGCTCDEEETATVAAPGPTAGDAVPTEAGLRAYADALPITWGRQLVRDVALAMDRHAQASRAELLAEITEPSMAVWLAGAMSQCGYSATVVLRAIALKLGGTKE